MKAKLKNHAKLLAEAIPALSGPTGGSKLSKIGGADLNSDFFKQPGLWPARADRDTTKRNRWLHGDYKDLAYLYVHELYDRCTSEMRGGLGP